MILKDMLLILKDMLRAILKVMLILVFISSISSLIVFLALNCNCGTDGASAILISGVLGFSFGTVWLLYSNITLFGWSINIPQLVTTLYHGIILKKPMIVLMDCDGRKRLSLIYVSADDHRWCKFVYFTDRMEKVNDDGTVESPQGYPSMTIQSWRYFSDELELERKLMFN